MGVDSFILGEDTEFEIVNDIDEATHWVAYEDEGSIIKDSITPWKKYRLEYIKDAFGYDYFVIDEDGNYSMAYMVHKGDFIKIY